MFQTDYLFNKNIFDLKNIYNLNYTWYKSKEYQTFLIFFCYKKFATKIFQYHSISKRPMIEFFELLSQCEACILFLPKNWFTGPCEPVQLRKYRCYGKKLPVQKRYSPYESRHHCNSDMILIQRIMGSELQYLSSVANQR